MNASEMQKGERSPSPAAAAAVESFPAGKRVIAGGDRIHLGGIGILNLGGEVGREMGLKSEAVAIVDGEL